MHPSLLALAERAAPRYTSYPTAPHFGAHIGGADTERWLRGMPEDARLSLYLHVPYCREICWYCGCNTFAARRDEPLLDYVETLCAEIEQVAAAVAGRSVIEIHWGGGTPNILSPEQFARIAAQLSARFNLSALAKHAVEIDPRSLDPATARAFAANGVNRASLGVQDLNEHVQQLIGRVQPLDVVQRAIDTLRNEGIRELSIDLMYGLPDQSLDDLSNTVRLVAAMRPNRISLFGYAHVPWFKKRQRLIDEARLPSATERFEQAERARVELAAAGYVAIGLDHYALPSDDLAVAAGNQRLRRSFQGYVIDEPTAIIGLGPSAISTLPQGYAQNASEPAAWRDAIAAGALATVRGHAISADDCIRRRLIEQIMCDFAGDLAPLGGAKACVREIEALRPLAELGLVHIAGDRITLSEEARPFCRLVAMAFDSYVQPDATQRHSRAV